MRRLVERGYFIRGALEAERRSRTVRLQHQLHTGNKQDVTLLIPSNVTQLLKYLLATSEKQDGDTAPNIIYCLYDNMEYGIP